MKHRRLVWLAGAILAITAAAVCVGQSGSAPLIITENDNGKTLQATVGQKIFIQLPSNPTTGYTWVVPRDTGPLVRGKKTYTANGSNLAGAGGTQSLEFYAKDTGTATLTLEYKRPWENDPPARTFTVTVNVVSSEKKN